MIEFHLNLFFCFRRVAKALRTVQGRTAVQPHLSSALTARNHRLDHLFYTESLEVPKKKSPDTVAGESEFKPGVFCSDLGSMVSHLIECRDLDPDKADVHIGIDGGQGSVKVGITVTTREDSQMQGRAKYSYVSIDISSILKISRTLIFQAV